MKYSGLVRPMLYAETKTILCKHDPDMSSCALNKQKFDDDDDDDDDDIIAKMNNSAFLLFLFLLLLHYLGLGLALSFRNRIIGSVYMRVWHCSALCAYAWVCVQCARVSVLCGLIFCISMTRVTETMTTRKRKC